MTCQGQPSFVMHVASSTEQRTGFSDTASGDTSLRIDESASSTVTNGYGDSLWRVVTVNTDETSAYIHLSMELPTWLGWIVRQRSPRLGYVVVVPMVMMVMVVGMAMVLGLHGTGKLNCARTRNLAMQFPTVRPPDKLQGVVNNPSPE